MNPRVGPARPFSTHKPILSSYSSSSSSFRLSQDLNKSRQVKTYQILQTMKIWLWKGLVGPMDIWDCFYAEIRPPPSPLDRWRPPPTEVDCDDEE